MQLEQFVLGLEALGCRPCRFRPEPGGDPDDLLNQAWVMGQFDGIESVSEVVVAAVQNPDPEFPGPMLWVTFLSHPDRKVEVRRVLANTPLSAAMSEEDLDLVHWAYEGRAFECSFESLLQALQRRIERGYAPVEMPPHGYLLTLKLALIMKCGPHKK